MTSQRADPPSTARGRTSFPAGWRLPAGLLALTVVPVAAGVVRLTQLIVGADITAENARFFASPAPVVVHIVSVTAFAVLGVFQFVPRIRRRRPGWHRVVGRILVPSGLAAALSGLWMTLFYPRPPDVGDLLSAMRLVFGSAMAAAIVLGFLAIRRGDVARHRAWMIRGYAIGMGAGTQVITNLPWLLIFGTPDQLARAMLMGAGWVINLAVAELAIRRTFTRRVPSRGTVGPRSALSSRRSASDLERGDPAGVSARRSLSDVSVTSSDHGTTPVQ